MTAAPAGQLRHHTLRVHARCQHVAVIAIGGDDAVAVFQGGLNADDHRFLSDIEVAEAADQAHAIKLTRLLFETADQQHVAVVVE